MQRIIAWSIGFSTGRLAGTGESHVIVFCQLRIIEIGTSGSSNGQLANPMGITVDLNTDILYVSDSYNHRVMRYLPNSTVGTMVAGTGTAGLARTQLNIPRGLIYDAMTNSLVIANSVANNIVRWVLGAQNWTLMAGSTNGTSGGTALLLNSPKDRVFDSMGYMYVADEGNHRVQSFARGQLNGTTIAGVTGVSGSSATLLNACTSVAFDSHFHLYVVDYLNARVQKFIHVTTKGENSL
jgi:sugar lactone lactonase YvrE